MPTRHVNLTDHYDRFVEAQIVSGRYKNASEVMRAGLRLLEQQARENEEKLAAPREVAAKAFEALDQGAAIAIEGEKQPGAFIRSIGLRAAWGSVRCPGGK